MPKTKAPKKPNKFDAAFKVLLAAGSTVKNCRSVSDIQKKTGLDYETADAAASRLSKAGLLKSTAAGYWRPKSARQLTAKEVIDAVKLPDLGGVVGGLIEGAASTVVLSDLRGVAKKAA